MRKISLIPYKCDGLDYDVRKSLASMMFIPELHLGARDIIENDRIARKIESAQDEVVLEEAEYARIKQSFDLFQNYSRNDLELIRRVRDAPEIDANTPSNGGN